MNRAFLIVLIPAALIGALYWSMGMRPSWRALAGVALFAGLLLYVLRKKK
jgi:hypothetical protein